MAELNMGQKIKVLREENNLTLEQVGEAVGVGKSTVRKWETGMIANMRRDKIAALAQVLHTTPAYLMGWDELDEQVDLEKLRQDIQKEGEAEKIIINRYGKDVWDALCMYIQLDGEDRAEVRGMMKGLYRNDKYSIQDGLKKRIGNIIYVKFK